MSLISGIKEKVIAAKRLGIGKVMLQIDNERDYDGMQGYLKKILGAHLVSGYQAAAKI